VLFRTTVLGRYDVDFLKCQVCASLQPQRPFWVAESYTAAIAAADTGAMTRNLVCHAAVYIVSVICRVRGRFLDSGGGAGVLCRLLRDHGFDAWVSDKYADPVFARAFALPADACRSGEFALVSAVEVLEHFEDPAAELGRLFALQPRVLLATTQVYSGEGRDWWYLLPQTGQHLFFYSRRCLELLARRHGYHYLGVGSLHVFAAVPPGWLQRLALRWCLSDAGLGLVRLWLTATLRGRFSNRDYVTVSAALAEQQAAAPTEGRSA
jgi:hypothetical protein